MGKRREVIFYPLSAGLLIEASERAEENTPKALKAHSNISVEISFIFIYSGTESSVFVSRIFYLSH